MPKPRIMFDNDARHPLIYMYEPPIRKEEYQSAVDELVGTPVEALTFSLGDTQSLLHDTRVGGTWGADIEKWPHLIWKRALQNSRVLIAEGNDPLRVICDRAHETGILIYPLSVRAAGGPGAFHRELGGWGAGRRVRPRGRWGIQTNRAKAAPHRRRRRPCAGRPRDILATTSSTRRSGTSAPLSSRRRWRTTPWTASSCT